MLSCGESGGVREGTTASKEPMVEKRISIWGIVLCVGGRDVGTSVFDAFIFPIDIFFRKPHRPLFSFPSLPSLPRRPRKMLFPSLQSTGDSVGTGEVTMPGDEGPDPRPGDKCSSVVVLSGELSHID